MKNVASAGRGGKRCAETSLESSKSVYKTSSVFRKGHNFYSVAEVASVINNLRTVKREVSGPASRFVDHLSSGNPLSLLILRQSPHFVAAKIRNEKLLAIWVEDDLVRVRLRLTILVRPRSRERS